jgi:hypothetical protein
MRFLLAVLGVLLLAGCSSSATPGPSPTAAQGSARLDSYLTKVLAIKGPAFSKDPTGTTNDPSACVRFSNGQPTGQVEAQVKYTAKIQPTTDVTAFLDAAAKAWAGLLVTRSDNEVSASDTNDYKVAVTYYPAVHELDLTGVSPCLWPNGTPSR